MGKNTTTDPIHALSLAAQGLSTSSKIRAVPHYALIYNICREFVGFLWGLGPVRWVGEETPNRQLHERFLDQKHNSNLPSLANVHVVRLRVRHNGACQNLKFKLVLFFGGIASYWLLE